jgi:protein gp37
VTDRLARQVPIFAKNLPTSQAYVLEPRPTTCMPCHENSSMAFHEAVPFDFIQEKSSQSTRAAHCHEFQVLTLRSIADAFRANRRPANVWVSVNVEARRTGARSIIRGR